MHATQELRRLLRKRGVEWYEGANPAKTIFKSPNLGVRVSLTEGGGGGICLDTGYAYITLEQAIEITLGIKCTCYVIGWHDGVLMDDPGWYDLSCGHVYETFDDEPPKFCPECGRKVVSE